MSKAKHLTVICLVGIAAVASPASAMPTDPPLPPDPPPSAASAVQIDLLAHATIGDPVHVNSAGIKIATRGARDLLTAAITVDPGGSFGWHNHPGPVVVAVTSGTLSLIEGDRNRCDKRLIGPGHGFVEDGRHVHLARNDGSDPVLIDATFLARSGTAEFVEVEPDPGACRL